MIPSREYVIENKSIILHKYRWNKCRVRDLQPVSIKCVIQSRYCSPQLRDTHALIKMSSLPKMWASQYFANDLRRVINDP